MGHLERSRFIAGNLLILWRPNVSDLNYAVAVELDLFWGDDGPEGEAMVFLCTLSWKIFGPGISHILQSSTIYLALLWISLGFYFLSYRGKAIVLLPLGTFNSQR